MHIKSMKLGADRTVKLALNKGTTNVTYNSIFTTLTTPE